VVGEAAEAQAALDPERVERTPKGRLGDPVMLLGGRPVDPVDALAAILGHVGAAAAQRMAGTAPARLVLTHPAPWGSARLDLLRDAARRARLPDPVLVSEPVAAAAHLAHDIAAPGALLAVYDLGGGTFDAAIVRRTPDGFVVAGPPGGDDSLGGEALDDLVVRAVLERLDPDTAEQLTSSDDRVWRQARWQLRRDARTAKEALSSSSTYRWYLGAPVDAELSLSNAELEALVRDSIIATARSLLEAIRRAGLSPAQLATVVNVDRHFPYRR
jgi:molecular chaperone DnaK (HSP70)